MSARKALSIWNKRSHPFFFLFFAGRLVPEGVVYGGFLGYFAAKCRGCPGFCEGHSWYTNAFCLSR